MMVKNFCNNRKVKVFKMPNTEVKDTWSTILVPKKKALVTKNTHVKY
jgi:hypothetical protein